MWQIQPTWRSTHSKTRQTFRSTLLSRKEKSIDEESLCFNHGTSKENKNCCYCKTNCKCWKKASWYSSCYCKKSCRKRCKKSSWWFVMTEVRLISPLQQEVQHNDTIDDEDVRLNWKCVIIIITNCLRGGRNCRKSLTPLNCSAEYRSIVWLDDVLSWNHEWLRLNCICL